MNKIFKQLTKANFLENLVLFLYMINKNLLEYQILKEFGMIKIHLNPIIIYQNINNKN